ncbi:Hypothetical predicted protein [Octopus vulgaris]|uniref:Uncharacterized protein n=1 Tax=Octopus vulgaris TaxID=6645 RepID=A0AA36AN45_OCTVU|nr:Hypothetical predicted protein [Octopus vulgaris]
MLCVSVSLIPSAVEGSGGSTSATGVVVGGVDGVADVAEVAVVAGVSHLPAFTDFAVPAVDDAVVAGIGADFVAVLAGVVAEVFRDLVLAVREFHRPPSSV